MRKFLLFLIILPTTVVLGHDIYMFSQNPEKGFRLSDAGTLWAKYHKESHDKWKINLEKLGKTVDDLNIIEKIPTPPKQPVTNQNSYSGSFTQTNEKGKEASITKLKQKDIVQTNTSEAQDAIGFILEQKALFIFAILSGVILFLYAIIRLLFREKSGEKELTSHKKKKIKKNKHGYGRK